MSARAKTALAAVAVSCAVLRAAEAQGPAALWAEAASTAVRSHSRFGDVQQSVGGYIWGVDAGGSFWRISLRAGYASGSLDPRSSEAGGASREHTEGYFTVGFRPVGGLEITVGPLARAMSVDDRTQRWLFWNVGMKYQADILPQSLGAHVEYWGALAGSAGGASSFLGGSGGKAGLTARLPGSALFARVEYAIDDASVNFRDFQPGLVDVILGGSGSPVSVPRRETVQGIKASIGLRWR